MGHPVNDLRVRRWKRYGQERLYVDFLDGRNVACYDVRTGGLTITDGSVDQQVLRSALAPHLPTRDDHGTVPASWNSAVGPGTGPAQDRESARGTQSARGRESLTGQRVLAGSGVRHGNPSGAAPGDLAAQPPGAAISGRLAELEPGFWPALADRLLRRRRPETESWRKGLAGERIVAAELADLAERGWRVLHSIPLARGVDIDHLLIGPGGVFTINSKFHEGRRIWVGDDSARIGPNIYPYVRKARAEARRASTALGRACGFDVCVAGVLAFVEAEQLTVVPTLMDVYPVHHDELSANFGDLGGVWNSAEVDHIHTSARDPRTWVDV